MNKWNYDNKKNVSAKYKWADGLNEINNGYERWAEGVSDRRAEGVDNEWAEGINKWEN